MCCNHCRAAFDMAPAVSSCLQSQHPRQILGVFSSYVKQPAENCVDLNQVTIPCRNYEESVEFYVCLGLRQIVDSPPRYARFETASGTTLSIHLVETTIPNTEVVIYFEVANVDETVQKLRSAGLEFENEPTDQTWLWREAYILDPFGNKVCIYHAGQNRRYPPWRMEAGA